MNEIIGTRKPCRPHHVVPGNPETAEIKAVRRRLSARLRLVATPLLCSMTFVWSLSGSAQSNGLKLGGEDAAQGGAATVDLGPADNSAAPSAGSPSPAAGLEGAVISPEELVRSQHGAWEVACAKGGAPCVMAQIGEDSQGTPILEMVLRKLPEAQELQGVSVIAVTDIITPLGVVLTSGLAMKIDGSEEQRAPFQVCTEQGCLVREPLTEETISRLKKGASAKITVVSAQHGPVETVLSLSGFTKAYNSLK